MMNQKELNVVRFSMVVLFSSLMIVYLMLYQIKGEDISHQLSKSTIENELYNSEPEDSNNNIDKKSDLIDSLDGSGNIELPIDESIVDSKSSESVDSLDKIHILSGTSLWYGRIDVVEYLGISYQYALKDLKDVYYVFIDPSNYNFDKIVKDLGGDIYTISTEKDIVENKLFGDKIMFINLPEYKEKKVIMLVYIDNHTRLLQINYDKYHSLKGHIKNIFTN